MAWEKQRRIRLLICLLFFWTPLFASKSDSTQLLETRPFGHLAKLNDQTLVFHDPKTQEMTALFFAENHFRIEYIFRRAVSDTLATQFVLNNKPIFVRWLSAKRVILFPSEINVNGLVHVIRNGKEKDRFQLRRKQVKTIPLTLIQTQHHPIKAEAIESELNQRFLPFFLSFKVNVSYFKHEKFKANYNLNNPNRAHLRYTRQMIHLRELMLAKEGNKYNDQLLFFCVKGFTNPAIKHYMVHDKALGFVAYDTLSNLVDYIESSLVTGFFNSEENLNKNNSDLHYYDLYSFPPIFSLIDDYEEVKTNSGLIAYYFYEVNDKNEIQDANSGFLGSIERPIKKNTYSYHLQIDNFFFKYLFIIKGAEFNLLHIIGFVIIGVIWVFTGRRIRRFLKQRFAWSLLLRMMSWMFEIVTLPILCWLFFIFINLGYKWFEVQNGVITEFEGLNSELVLDKLMLNVNPSKNQEPTLGSEIIIKKGKSFELLRRKKVLYFETQITENGKSTKLISSSDSLILRHLDWSSKAFSHYFVHTQVDAKGKIIGQQVFNHLGIDLSDKLTLEDPPKRILVFVNGYRPTTLGITFEENFNDIEKNGLEFPNSLNRLFPNDRYNYWHPWNTIDDKFKAKINPSEIFYADGHHSVSTSNHRSIVRFTTNSNAYPKRCKNLKKHTCYSTKTMASKYFGSSQKATVNYLATKPNKRGFKIRKNSGIIAGRNLFQLLNELPNRSKNDTLYLVVHSMGYAYSLGMVDYMRGKINFGGYFILAPENAQSGKVIAKEWKQVWQYGSNLNGKHPDAPCLQDGVAPQSLAGGLKKEHQIFIPQTENRHKGYFDSHFVGYYNWIFKLKPGNQGYIKQN